MINIELGVYNQWWTQTPLSVEHGMFDTVLEARLECIKRNRELARDRGLLDKPFPLAGGRTYQEYYDDCESRYKRWS